MKNYLIHTVIFLLLSVVLTQKIYANENKTELNLSSLPLTFIENIGQWDEHVKFCADADGATIWFSSDGTYHQFCRTVETDENSLLNTYETMMIKTYFRGANKNDQIVGLEKLNYKSNYFIGSDKSKWASNVPSYKAILYKEIYNGIDLKYYGNGTYMEYDFIVASGADVSQIEIQYDGVESVTIDNQGQLVVTTMWGQVTEQKPIIYQIENNTRVAIEGSYILQSDNTFGFTIKDYNKEIPLVIDPILNYSTYLGGSKSDYGTSIAVDSSGAVYVMGHTSSTNFPLLNPYQTGDGSTDVFVSKLNSAGDSLIYSTFVGGSSTESAKAIAVDIFGDATITGGTYSSDFPAVNAYIETFQGGYEDAFVAKLSNSGDSLVYSTYLGGDNSDFANGVAVDQFGASYVVGTTISSNFPTNNAFRDTAIVGDRNAFVTKFNRTGDSLIYSTYLGGSNGEFGTDVALDSTGAAYVTGYTYSSDFPILNPYQGSKVFGQDVFVTKLHPEGNSLLYSTYLGGDDIDQSWGIAVDKLGAVYLTGYTASTNFPTLNSIQSTLQGESKDVFVSKLNPLGNSLVYSTYLGGDSTDMAKGIVVDEHGIVTIVGRTTSLNYPVYNPYQPTNQGVYDAFVTQIDSIGSSLEFSTYLGGSGADYGNAIAIDKDASIYITGHIFSKDFPTLNPYQNLSRGNYDAFVAKFSKDIPTDIDDFEIDNLPSNFTLKQNYPNPFNPSTIIEFNLPTKTNVTINIYNLLGQQVLQLANQEYSAGNHKITWDGHSSDGGQASTGIYLYRIITDDFVETKKMLLLK